MAMVSLICTMYIRVPTVDYNHFLFRGKTNELFLGTYFEKFLRLLRHSWLSKQYHFSFLQEVDPAGRLVGLGKRKRNKSRLGHTDLDFEVLKFQLKVFQVFLDQYEL